ncbi:MAG: AI-2E family transporter [Oscillospiraceae bacterium]
MNSDDKRKVKIGVAISASAISIFLILQNIESVLKFLSYIFGLLAPFLIGFGFAFALNIFMRMLEEKAFSRFDQKPHKIWSKLKRPVSVLITVTLFLGVVTSLVMFILPQLAASVTMLINNIPNYLVSLEEVANNVLNMVGLTSNVRETITLYWNEIVSFMTKFIGDSFPKMFEYTLSFTTGLFNVFIGFVIGIYMLVAKEKLLRNCKESLFAFIPERVARRVESVLQVTQKTFTKFVTGQLTEAVIVGVLCYIGMTCFRMEYALLISVIVGFTNIIPIFGPIIGTIPGAFILLLVDPIKAMWFVIFIIVLQQLESNFIYPKVVGGSIGLPALWVMFAVMIGGSVFGLLGIILGVPTFAVIYQVSSTVIKNRLEKKNLDI